MKIEKTSHPLPASSAGEGRVTTPHKNGTATASKQPESTSVSLGSTAAQLRSMEEGLSSAAPAFNAEKVAEIKQAISEGRFKINPELVADRLIVTVRELIEGKA